MSLDAEHVASIQRIWSLVSKSDGALVISLVNHLEMLEPQTAQHITENTYGVLEQVVPTISEFIASLDASQKEQTAFVSKIRALAELPHVKSLEPSLFPSIQRACLFTLWQRLEALGEGYNDEIAKAFSRLLDIVDSNIFPSMSRHDRSKRNYFNRRAPGNTIAIESPEALRKEFNRRNSFDLAINGAL